MSDTVISELLQDVPSTELIYYQLAFLVTAFLLIGLDWVLVSQS